LGVIVLTKVTTPRFIGLIESTIRRVLELKDLRIAVALIFLGSFRLFLRINWDMVGIFTFVNQILTNLASILKD